MSDPVTNADIEDVLSSIRRLVAEDERPKVAAPSRPAASDRLVLTPALRVMESDAPEEMPSEEPRVTDESVNAAPTDEEMSELPQPELVEGHELSGLDIDDTAKRNLETRIAELEAVISDTGGQWEQDGEEGSANAGGDVAHLDWNDDAEPASVAEIEEAQMAELVEPEPIEADTVDAMPFLRHDFSVLQEGAEDGSVEEATVTEEKGETDEVQHDPVTEAPDEEPVSEPEVAAHTFEAEQDFSDLGHAEHHDDHPYEGQDYVVDEAALRALVEEIVHQELQGKLGERITRNVRNLVRREIHRALTSQELE
jgi:hypothetical protein